jgi:hypothetical protein
VLVDQIAERDNLIKQLQDQLGLLRPDNSSNYGVEKTFKSDHLKLKKQLKSETDK